MKAKLELSVIEAYQLSASIDEWNSRTIGYYQDENLAKIAAEGAGWWGQNGRVNKVEIYTDGINLYDVDGIGKFLDDEAKREEIQNKILDKLTNSEIAILKSIL